MKLVNSLEFKKVLSKFTHRNPENKVNHTEWSGENISKYFSFDTNLITFFMHSVFSRMADYHLLCNFSSWFSIMCTERSISTENSPEQNIGKDCFYRPLGINKSLWWFFHLHFHILLWQFLNAGKLSRRVIRIFVVPKGSLFTVGDSPLLGIYWGKKMQY